VDLRESSSTFGKWVGVELSAENKKQMWIPEGFAHGFLVLSDKAEVLYKATNYWNPVSEKCILWSDTFLNINWPLASINPSMSVKDELGCSWDLADKYE
jgi:dTDP-4-dehydrorhamnose 3,5-epimerase